MEVSDNPQTNWVPIFGRIDCGRDGQPEDKYCGRKLWLGGTEADSFAECKSACDSYDDCVYWILKGDTCLLKTMEVLNMASYGPSYNWPDLNPDQKIEMDKYCDPEKDYATYDDMRRLSVTMGLRFPETWMEHPCFWQVEEGIWTGGENWKSRWHAVFDMRRDRIEIPKGDEPLDRWDLSYLYGPSWVDTALWSFVALLLGFMFGVFIFSILLLNVKNHAQWEVNQEELMEGRIFTNKQVYHSDDDDPALTLR